MRSLLAALLAVVCASDRVVGWTHATTETIFIKAEANLSLVQPVDTELIIGQDVQATITRDQVNLFTLHLESDQFAQVRIDWQGIDLKIESFDPSSEKLQVSPIVVVAPGPITFYLHAKSAGQYKIQITGTIRQKVAGTFQIKLEGVHAPSQTDQFILSAQQLLADGLAKGSTPEAIAKIEQALQILESLQNKKAEGQTLLALGDAYRASRQTEKARSTYERAIESFTTNNDPRGHAYALTSLGNLIRTAGTPTGGAKDSLPKYEEASSLFRQAGDQRGLASALYYIGFSKMRIGRTAEGLSALNESLSIRRVLKDPIGVINNINIIADAYRILGDLDRSLSLYQEANQLITGLEYSSMEATLSNGLALVYDDWGDWQRAREGYLRALTIQESLLGPLGLDACRPKPANPTACRSAATYLDNLAETFNSLGDYDKALAQLNRSLQIRLALDEPAGLGNTRFHLGYTNYLLGNNGTALTDYSQAVQSLEKAGDDKTLALTYTYMGMIHIAQNNPSRALELYKKAMPSIVKSGDKRAQAITSDKLATSYASLRNWEDAKKAYDDALQLWRAVKDPDGEALTLHNMARTERDMGNLDAANQFSEDAINLVERIRTKVSSERLRASYLAKFENFYELDIDLKMQISKTQGRNELIASALESAEKSRARVLLDTLSEAGVGRGESTTDPKLESLRKERLELVNRLAARERARTQLLSESASADLVAAVDREIDQIGNRFETLEAGLKTLNPQFAALTKPEPSNVKQIQEQLDDETLLIEYFLGDVRSYVWVVGSKSIIGRELPPRAEIERAAKRVYEALAIRGQEQPNEKPLEKLARIRKGEADFEQASAILSDLILRQIGSELNGRRLVIIADGPLQTLPFAALSVSAPSAANTPTGTSPLSQPLIENYEIISLPSASVLVLQRHQFAGRQQASLPVAVVADPVFDRNDPRVAVSRSKNKLQNQAKGNNRLTDPEDQKQVVQSMSSTRALSDVGWNSPGEVRRLSYSFEEAQRILQLAPPGKSFVALDFKANKATVLSKELSRYRIIHLATHGIMNLNHPELSGVLLSMVDEQGRPQNGFLGLSEIYSLNLPADLVVLSACETGVGKEVRGEGLIALTRGFMYAGAERVVASLWRVDDVATAQLMTEFYREMFANKLKPAAALRSAQRKLANSRRWHNPHYWAGFVLLGEWR